MASNPAQIMGAAQALVPDPVTQDLNRQMAHLQIAGATLQNQAAAQQLRAQQVAMQRQQNFGQAVQDHLTNPSVQSLARVFSYPEFAAQAKEVSGAMDDRRRQSDLTQISAATGLAAKGDYTGAADIIDKRVAADKAAGVDSSADEHFSTALRSGDPQQQKNAFGAMTLALGAAVGPEKAGPYLEAMGLSKKPIIVGLDQRAIDTSDGRTIVGATPKLEPVGDTLITGETVHHPFNPYTGKFGAAAVDGGTPAGTSSATPTGGGGPASGGGGLINAMVPITAQSESRNRDFNSDGTPVTSPKGAQGRMQVMPGTNADPGYGVRPAADNSPEERARVGRDYLAAMMQRYGGDPAKAWAAYNGGPGRLDKALSAGPNWMSKMPAETRKYVMTNMRQLRGPATAMADTGVQSDVGGVGGAPASAFAPAAPASAGAADPYSSIQTGGGAAPVNTKGAPPGFTWNADHTAVVPLKGGAEDLSSYPPQMIHDAAVELLTTGQMPSFGMGGGAIKKAILDQRSQIMKQAGITADSLPQFRARYAADKGTYQNIVGMESGLAASEHALLANFQQVRQTQQKLVDLGILGNSPDLNGAKIRWVEHFGSPEQKAALQQYRLAINGSQGEYAKFMSTNTGMGNAPSTDSARAKAGEMIEEGGAVSATNGGIDQLMKEAANKRAGVTAQRVYLEHKLSSYLGGAGAPAAPATAAPPANHAAAPAHAGGLPPGAHQVGTYQGKPVYQLPNGKKVMAR